MNQRIRLGDLLIQKGLLTDSQLKKALSIQKKTGLKLGKIFIKQQWVTELDILTALSNQLNIPIISPATTEINNEVAKLLPEAYARKFRAMVVDNNSGTLQVAMCDPLDLNAIDELKLKLKHPIQLTLITEEALLRTLDIIYRRSEEISALAEELHDEFVSDDVNAYQLADLELDKAKVDAPVVKFLRTIFEDADQAQASDIHIEPDKDVLRIRLRVFGVLQEQIFKEKDIASAVALRLKLMASLNISERRLPQDGRFNIKVGQKIIEVRLSTMPTQYGESIVMRLLDQSTGLLNLENIGLSPDMLTAFRKLIHLPNGILLVTGPTGSGKSTTLYGALNELNSSEKKIITVEDPIEYELPRVCQVQVQEKLGLTFAKILRSILRQDPDIVLIGEMRDEETADIAIRAALTGHLVLSTLHTNDAPSTALRLMDMNIDGFLLSATIRGILAQRLIRRLCKHCAKPHTASSFELNWIQDTFGKPLNTDKLMKNIGCSYCSHSGFSGRIGIHELLLLNDLMAEALRTKNPERFMQLAKKELQGNLLLDKALALAEAGITTVSEIFALAGDS